MNSRQKILGMALLLVLALAGLMMVASGKLKTYNAGLIESLKQNRVDVANRIRPVLIRMAGDLPHNPEIADGGHVWIMRPGGKEVSYRVSGGKLVRIETGKQETLAENIIEMQVNREKGTHIWQLYVKAYLPDAPPGTQVLIYHFTFAPSGKS
ncbi:MAG: hypothetical protein M1269_02295 [Chloroflexi bacterium]|nr:hypothetical protein [Chloroflexota bacterium]